jgi:hypothetical protein
MINAFTLKNENDETNHKSITGSNNVFIGYPAAPDVGLTNLNNIIAIGASSTVGQSNSMVLGGLESMSVRVGIGTSTPKALLTISTTTEELFTDYSLLQVATTTNQGIFVVGRDGYTYLGNTPEGNYSYFEPDGTLVFAGSATVWNDANVGGLTLGKGVTSPDEDNLATSTVRILSFAGTGVSVQSASGCIETPHDYKEGTDIVPHVHMISSSVNTGNVKMQMEISWGGKNGQFEPAATTTNSIVATTKK